MELGLQNSRLLVRNLDSYIAAELDAIQHNPPRTQDGYAENPKRIWKYYMRNFGAGLCEFPESEVKDVLGSLYGKFFIMTDFTTSRADINAKEFLGWITSAWKENCG